MASAALPKTRPTRIALRSFASRRAQRVHGNATWETVSMSRSLPSWWTGSPLRQTPAPVTALYSSSRTGSSTTPTVGTPPTTSAIEAQKNGSALA